VTKPGPAAQPMTASGFTMATMVVLADPGWKDGGRADLF
jgi:hypothetical protein